jgi:hypothetical protein
VSWWPGDGNTNDIRGGNNGTLQSGATYGAGEVLQGFSLNGSSSYVSIGNAASLKLNSLTIGGWINPTSTPASLGAVLTKWNQSVSTGSTGDSYGLFIQNVSGTLKLFTAIHQTSNAESTLTGGTIPLNTFSHVAVTFDSTTGALTLYVNGVSVANTTTAALGLVPSDVVVHIGRENDNVAARFFP